MRLWAALQGILNALKLLLLCIRIIHKCFKQRVTFFGRSALCSSRLHLFNLQWYCEILLQFRRSVFCFKYLKCNLFLWLRSLIFSGHFSSLKWSIRNHASMKHYYQNVKQLCFCVSSSPTGSSTDTRMAELPPAPQFVFKSLPGRNNQRNGAPSTPELPLRRQFSQSFR